MIIETRDDVVRLSGSLHKKQWLTIKAAANLLLKEHPEGIIIDCSELTDISADGAKTFLEAMRDIESARARIVVANLPKNILAVCQTIPGIRSQLPIADSVEDARRSLRAVQRAASPAPAIAGAARAGRILVPLVGNLDLTYGADLAARVARATRSDVRVVYFLEVARTLPLGAPLGEKEAAADEELTRAEATAKAYGIGVTPQVERVRDPAEGILATIRSYEATLVVLGASVEPIAGEAHDLFHHLVDTLLHRSPCEVVIGRQKIEG